MKITNEDKKKIIELSKHPEIYNLIINSIVPSIHGHNDVKEALALQLFGGVTKEIKDVGVVPGRINILIVGDPGIGKSHMLKGLSKLALNGVYFDSNKANVLRNDHNLNDIYDIKNFEADIFKSESSLVCIDELMIKPDEVVFIKEVLGKKASFNTKEEVLNILNSNCSILAASNPEFGRFDPYKCIVEQIAMPSNILSCFDLVFILEDKPNLEYDKKLADHILKFHRDNKIKSLIDYELLRKYITFARQEINPKLSIKATEMIQDFYIRARHEIYEENMLVTIGTRHLESLIKLSEANARMRLSKDVTTFDVKKIIKLFCKCLDQRGYHINLNIKDNNIQDNSYLITPKSEAELSQMFIDIIKEIENQYNGYAPSNIFITEVLNRYNINQDKGEELIKILKSMGLVYEPQKGFLKLV